MNAYFYSRVSTDHQDNSLDCQLAKARAYAVTRGFQLPDTHIFTDPDTSGSIPFSERPGGQLLLNTIALDRRLGRTGAPPVSAAAPAAAGASSAGVHLIITKLDRLGRSAADLDIQLQKFKDLTVTVHIIDMGGESLTTAGMVGDLLLRILGAVAQFEREMIRARAQEVIDHKREQGILLGTCPFGWNAVPTGDTNPKTGKPIHRLTPNPAEQQWLRQMAAWRAAGWSYHRIAADLNRAGVRTKVPVGQPIYRHRIDPNSKQRVRYITGRSTGLWQSGNVAHVLTNRSTRELLEPPAAFPLAA